MSTTRDALLWLLKIEHGFALEVPFRGVSGTRRFRWDAAHEGRRIAVEYQGKGKGHSYLASLDRDYEKATEGQLCGWTVILCNSESVNDGRCIAWVERALADAP